MHHRGCNFVKMNLIRNALFISTCLFSLLYTSNSEIAKANLEFAKEFYQVLAKEEGNIFFSPISAHSILSLLYQGSGGETADRLKQSLRLSQPRTAASSYKTTITALNNVENVTLHMANKIFIKNTYKLKIPFQNVAEKSFHSKIESTNFTARNTAAKTINDWIESKTNNKIKDVVSADDFSDTTVLVLVNAIYFKGNWLFMFEKQLTGIEKFHVSSKSTVNCQMMFIEEMFSYKEDTFLKAQILQLPYQNKDVSMLVILPHDRDGIKDVEKRMANTTINNIMDGLGEQKVMVSLPKFKIESTIDLQPVLTEMGLADLFDHPDLTNIVRESEPIYISKAVQKAFIEVNEEGAEAAVSTVFEADTRSLDVDTVSFRANHPFLIALIFKEGGNTNLLFAGRLSSP